MPSILARVTLMRWSIGLVAAVLLGTGSADGQTVTVTPPVGAGQRTVTITSAGFDSTYNTGFYLDGNFFAACPDLSAWGNCEITVQIPTGVVGPHTVEGANSHQERASTTYTVVEPTLRISPTCGLSGASLVVVGRHFTVEADAAIYVDGGLVRASNYPDFSGGFNTPISIGPVSTGEHVVRVANSHGIAKTANFTVPCDDLGPIITADGPVTLMHADGTESAVGPGAPLRQSDTIHTGNGARADITFADGTSVSIPADVSVRVDEFNYNPSTPGNDSALWTLVKGTFVYVSGLIGKNDPGGVHVDSPIGNLGIRGTDFVTVIDALNEQQTTYLMEGTISLAPWDRYLPLDYTGPVTITSTLTTVVTSPLTQEEYDLIKAQLFGTNTPPVAQDVQMNATEDTTASGTLTATDVDNQTLTYSIVTNGSKGSASIGNTATGAFTYTPNANATGTDTVTFKANDGLADSNIATVSISIAPINDPPVAASQSKTTPANTPLTGSLSATDVEDDTLSYSIVTNGTEGTATITNTATGAFSYTPASGASGADAFTFQAFDGSALSNLGTVSITIEAGGNQPPVAVSKSFTTKEDRAVSGALSGSDPERRAITFGIASNGTKGTAVITNASSGRFTYTPNLNANGTDTFVFRVSDGQLFSAPATVTVTISAVNDAPLAANVVLSTAVNTTKVGAFVATDPDGDAMTYAIAKGPARGTAIVTNATTGAFSYTPKAGFTGSDSFTYTARDASGAIGKASVTINVGP